MLCINCNTYVSENAEFCPNCGKKIGEVIIPMGYQSVNMLNNNKNSTKNIVFTVFVSFHILLYLFECLCLFLFPMGCVSGARLFICSLPGIIFFITFLLDLISIIIYFVKLSKNECVTHMFILVMIIGIINFALTFVKM